MPLRSLIFLLVLMSCDRPSATPASKASAAAQCASDSTSPYHCFAYDSLIEFGEGRWFQLSTPLFACRPDGKGQLRYVGQVAPLTFEAKRDSIRGYSQDSMEGNAEAPHGLRDFSYDSTARLLSFRFASAPRTMLEFQVSPSCDSLTGVMLIKTAFHPQDGTSGVAVLPVVLRRAK